MKKGGTLYTPQSARIVRYAGLVVPVVLVVYGYLDLLSRAGTTVSFEVISLISIGWIFIALWQFIFPSDAKSVALIRLVSYHAFAVAYLLFVTGIATPLALCWLLLIVASNIYFGRRGVLASVAVFMLVILAHNLLEGTQTVAVYDLALLLAVLLCGIVIMSISRAQSVDQIELQRSHEQEVLQRDRILTIINNLTDAVLSTDKNGIIRVYNAASLDLLDTNDSLNGHHIDTVLPLITTDDEALLPSSLIAKATTVHVNDDVWYQFEDGERVRLEVTVSPIRKAFKQNSSGNDGHILIMRDITKSKSLEEERDEFISVVSHELRTPITVVEGSLSNLEFILEKDAANKDTLKAAVGMAHDQTLYLAKMVNDLSTLSRAERGVADEKEVIEVKELVRSLYDTYAPQAHEKGLQFNLDVGAKLGQVSVSRLYLEELLQNFITNAIKYTKEGTVTLIAQRKQGAIHFAVKDTGIGISKTEQKKVFEKFYRSEDYRTRETNGTGLGLYVVTKLMRKLGTQVELTSRLNHGSTFSFSLPLHTEEKQ